MSPFPSLLAIVLLAIAADALAATDINNPYNSAVRRANPNSMQGTQSTTPSAPGIRQQVNPRPPTLQNGGIGNGGGVRVTPAAPAMSNPTPARSVDDSR